MKFIDILKIARQFQTSKIKKTSGWNMKKPTVIQLPITYNCNSKCVMCNIWNMDHSNEADSNEFSKFMSDELFSKVTSVGINGGEVSLIPNLPQYITHVLNLPKLKNLNIISNGFRGENLREHLSAIYKECKEKNVKLSVIISLDGYESIHDEVRGLRRAFEKATNTINDIHLNRHLYCDNFELACTVIESNVNNLVELDRYCINKGYHIKYRLGIENKRIESNLLVDNFSVIYNKNFQSAMEFFHHLYRRTSYSNFKEKFKYFAIFDWLNSDSDKKRRRLGCDWQDRGVTLDSRGALYYCAVDSDTIGSLRTKLSNGSEIFFSHNNLNYRQSIIDNSCNQCIHDYNGRPYLKDLLYFISEDFKSKLSMRIYKLKIMVGL